MFTIAKIATFIAAIGAVSAHGLITEVTGANGVTGEGFGVVASTPRDGSGSKPFQQDTSVIRDREIASGRTGVCGKTAIGGNNDVAAQMAAAVTAGLPSAAADGTVTMTLHQVNQDGGGPYTCDVSANGTGDDFQEATVTQNVPGIRGFSLTTAEDIPLVMQMPAGTACTGGPQGNACLVRCRNNTPAGPFGSCVAVTNAAGAAAGAAAAPATAAAGAADADADAGAGGAGAGGFLGKLTGAFGKRHLVSRFVGRNKTGKWI